MSYVFSKCQAGAYQKGENTKLVCPHQSDKVMVIQKWWCVSWQRGRVRETENKVSWQMKERRDKCWGNNAVRLHFILLKFGCVRLSGCLGVSGVGPTGWEFSDSPGEPGKTLVVWEWLLRTPTGVTHIGPPIPLSQKMYRFGNKVSDTLEHCFNHQWGLERARHKMLYYKHGSYEMAFIEPQRYQELISFSKACNSPEEWTAWNRQFHVSIFKETVYSSPWKVRSKPNATASILLQFNGILVISGWRHS